MERSSARSKYDAPYVTIHRADLHELLVQAAQGAGVNLQTGAAVDHIDGTRAVLHDGRVVEGDIIIGADGLKSAVRKLFEPVEAHFTGHVAWRALVPAEGPLVPLSDWPGVHIGPGRMIARYPVRGGSLLNLVFFARQDGWNDDLRDTYQGWCPEVQAMIEAASNGPIFKWAINARSPLLDWSMGGRIALMGGAAHAMTPFLGQGAACAIEDAIVLARALETSGDPADGLRRYVNARHERATFIQQESNANAERMQRADSDLFGLGEMRDEESLGLFEYDCRTVPV
jgi:salicylate hydroxylase